MRSISLVAAAVTGAALLLVACGGDDAERPAATPAAQGNPTDRAFVEQMIPHHQSAIDMARIAETRGESRFVKGLAADIIRTQEAEITELRRLDAELDADGVDVGSLDMPHDMMGMGADLDELERAKPFDRAFLEAMIPHHEGAVEMARMELEGGKNGDLRRIAEAIVEAQEREIAEMRDQLGS